MTKEEIRKICPTNLEQADCECWFCVAYKKAWFSLIDNQENK